MNLKQELTEFTALLRGYADKLEEMYGERFEESTAGGAEKTPQYYEGIAVNGPMKNMQTTNTVKTIEYRDNNVLYIYKFYETHPVNRGNTQQGIWKLTHVEIEDIELHENPNQ